jgi:hypothetical protein
MENISSWGAAIKGVGVTFREFFSQNDLALINGWDPVITTIRSTDYVTTFSGKTGAGFLQRFSDGSNIPSANRFKLYDTGFTQEPYGNRVEITRQTILYGQFDNLRNASSDLMTSVKVSLSRAGGQIFNRAFTSGSGITAGVRVVTYTDGVALASASHPRADGGTSQSNTSATSIPLTETNVEIARIALLNQLGDDGVPMMGPSEIWLVCGINNDKTARIIAGSELRSGTGNNDINIYQSPYLNVMSSSWLDNGISAAGVGLNTFWALVVPGWSKLVISISAGPDLTYLTDKGTKSALFDIILDLAVGSYDWRGVWLSQGNNAPYSG